MGASQPLGPPLGKSSLSVCQKRFICKRAKQLRLTMLGLTMKICEMLACLPVCFHSLVTKSDQMGKSYVGKSTIRKIPTSYWTAVI